MALCGVVRDEFLLRPADQPELVLVLAKVPDCVPLQDQHLGHQQPQLPISHHSYPVSHSQHLMRAQPTSGLFPRRPVSLTVTPHGKVQHHYTGIAQPRHLDNMQAAPLLQLT